MRILLIDVFLYGMRHRLNYSAFEIEFLAIYIQVGVKPRKQQLESLMVFKQCILNKHVSCMHGCVGSQAKDRMYLVST